MAATSASVRPKVFANSYLWQTQVQGLIQSVVSGDDILTGVLVGALAIVAAVPMILGLAIRSAFLLGTAARRVHGAVRR